MGNFPQISDWMDAVVESSSVLATTMLGLSGSEVIGTQDAIPQHGSAAYISIVGNDSAVQLGVGATPTSCQSLVKALMGMEPEDEDLDQEEVTDAFSEIINILAGQVKTIIGKKSDASINLGIPMFVKGELHVPDSSEIQITDARIGDIPVSFLVMRSDVF
jgi:CheY-specific phosphatase CheX